jgi:DNA polymerase I-like protein with 3'-5' exonuclease and polymerase domains
MTTLLIMHNAQHDLMWLWECGFKYDGDIYDTMLAEYILLRGQKEPLSLDACAERRGLEYRKMTHLRNTFKEGYNTNEIPLDELSFYLRVTSTQLVSCTSVIEEATPDSSCASLHNSQRHYLPHLYHPHPNVHVRNQGGSTSPPRCTTKVRARES